MKRTGFSLVELVVVIFIAAVLLGLLIPAVRSAQLKGENEQTVNNLKQMTLSIHACQDTYNRLPPAFDKFGQIKYPAAVHVHVMPFIQANKIYKTFLEEG
ncbi:MAG TPA: prepilin-type N-terminal cleavage/methylation domain-containing protein, partial [Gemmataceae bacterium]|nr:prepilin-type N-terminal cleavage/methylation domain-containing protein [Gemmataceae bacterium]